MSRINLLRLIRSWMIQSQTKTLTIIMMEKKKSLIRNTKLFPGHLNNNMYTVPIRTQLFPLRAQITVQVVN